MYKRQISYLTMMLKSFGMTLDVQETFLESVTTNKAYRKDFTTNRELFMRAVDDSANWRSIRSVLKREQLYELALSLIHISDTPVFFKDQTIKTAGVCIGDHRFQHFAPVGFIPRLRVDFRL